MHEVEIRDYLIAITPARDFIAARHSKHSFRRILMRRFIIATVVALAACGGGGSDTSHPTDAGSPDPVVAAATVHATPAIQFTPANVTLAVGGTVTFDFGDVAHNVFFDNAPAGAPANITAPSASTTVVRTFGTKGRYTYNCHLHPGMSGVVVVQ